ncbi:MAG: TrmH family RNA methyltransferase [Patescibacteria group bacterium]
MKNKASVLILENIRSVENTASIFRTADRFGVSRIILVGTTPAPLDRFKRERKDFVKVSLGAEKKVFWEHKKKIKSVIKSLRNDKFQIISLEQTPKAKSLRGFVPQDRFALIVGNEVSGISKDALETSDVVVEIPTESKKGSLNVSVATGIALFVLK